MIRYITLGILIMATYTLQAQLTAYLHQNWQFRQAGEDTWYPAEVPGSVHTDLIRQGLLKDPFYNDFEKEAQWVEEKDWEYRTSFSLSDQQLQTQHLELVFEGLDTYAKVWFNGKEILEANNMHRSWRIDIKPYAQNHNELLITFASAPAMGRQLSTQIPFKMPTDERIYVRKAQYQFGWDWGPRLVGCGIWQPVWIHAWNDAYIEQVQVQQLRLDDTLAKLQSVVRLQTTPAKNLTIEWEVQGETSATVVLQASTGTGGKMEIPVPFDIRNPKRWWCNGLGEAHLYRGTLRLLQEDSVIDSYTLQFGLRTADLVQEPDEKGKSFYFKINGQQVFAKGANFIPTHSFPEQTTEDTYRKQLLEIQAAGVNMLRIWGGGIYEEDIFYDLCDSLGIMVWQDFMFACAMYPGDTAFLENVRQEITEQTERLRNHPSIVLWCGNNEIDEAWHNWGWQVLFGYLQLQEKEIWGWYEQLFHQLIPEVLQQTDPGRPYWPSSPSIGWGRKEAQYSGDMHYWGVWWGKLPFRIYEHKVGRFMSEYGFQAMPSLFTLQTYLDSANLYLYSPALKQHQKHPVGYETIDDYMKRDFPVPAAFDDYVYVSQLLQGWGIQTALQAHQREMPYCMGTLYWQWNDCWPVTSWSANDHTGRRKALYYITRRNFGDQLLSAEDTNGRLRIHLIQHLPFDSLTVDLLFLTAKQQMVSYQVGVAANQTPLSRVIFEDVDTYRKTGQAVMAIVRNAAGDTLFTDILTWRPPNELSLKPAEVAYTYNEAQRSLTLRSDVFTWGVYVYGNNDELLLSDNYFHLMPGISKTIYLEDDAEVPGEIKIKTLNQVKEK